MSSEENHLAIVLNPRLARLGFMFVLALFVLIVSWELYWDPLREGGSLAFLYALPLMFSLPGLYRGNNYTFQWTSLLVLFYFMIGVVRGYSDSTALSRGLGWAECLLATGAFLCCIFYVRPSKKALKKRKAHGR